MALARPLAGTGVGVPSLDPLCKRALLNNAKNALGCGGGTADIEVVTCRPPLQMWRADTGPAKERSGPLPLENPRAKLVTCANTQANSRAEGHTSDPERS